MTTLPPCLFAAALMTVAWVGSAAEPPAEKNPWRALSTYRFTDARAAFASQPGRASRLGEAGALLNVQPKTEANLERAAGLLDALVAENARDEVGFSARYLRARLDQVHRQQPRLAEAARGYRELLAEAPAGHLLAQEAAVKLALIELYSPGEHSPEARLAAAETLGERLVDRVPRRDFHLSLGRAYLFYDRSKEKALRHLESAWEAGIVGFSHRADTVIAIAELRRDLGQTERARAAYELFLSENPRDDRRNSVRQRLREMEGALPVVSSP